MLRRLAALALLALVPTGAACGDGCGQVDCSAGSVWVSWWPGDLPIFRALDLCIDGDCKTVAPSVSRTEGRRDVHRSTTEWANANVELVLFDGDGHRITSFAGTTDDHMNCCPGSSLKVDDDHLREWRP